MKNKLSLGFFWYKKKKLKRTGASSILSATVIGHFSSIFRIRSSSISTFSEDSRTEYVVFWIQKPFVMYSLSIYYSSRTGERKRAEYITGGGKDQFDIVMQTSSNTE